jgi:CDK-activating kinase assembly factor MAT1
LPRFNKRREDFPDLRIYNDYLEEVEDITFNLINDIDVQKTEARIAKYRAENAALIELNIQRDEQYAAALKEQEELERQNKEQRAAELRREEEEEREEREKGRREIIDKLETSDKDARKLIAKSKAKAEAKRSQTMRSLSSSSNSQLLRSRAARSTVIPDVPHVPLQDSWYAYEESFTLRREGYRDFLSEAVRKDREGIMRGGGYMVEEAWERAIRSAVAELSLAPLSGLRDPRPDAPQLDANGDVIMASV